MSLDAEMMLEQLKEQHLHEMEELRNQLERKVSASTPIIFHWVTQKCMNYSDLKTASGRHADIILL